MPSHVLALDQGTTSSRALLFDSQGTLLAAAQRGFRQYFPQPGHVEHDAREILSSQLEAVAEVVQRLAGGAADIASVGLANQRETTLLWDRRTGAPPRVAQSCARAVSSPRSHVAPASSSIPIFPRPSSHGSSMPCRTRARAPQTASSPSARWTPGSHGS